MFASARASPDVFPDVVLMRASGSLAQHYFPFIERSYTPAMLDALKNLGNLPGLMAKAREMQDKMKAVQEDLARRQFASDAGAGAVTAIVNGRLELVKVRIDKSKLDPNDTELLEDVIVAAVVSAQAKAAAGIQEEMAKVSAGLGVPPGMIPGM